LLRNEIVLNCNIENPVCKRFIRFSARGPGDEYR